MTFVCAPFLNQIKTQIFKTSEMNIFIVLLNWVSLKYICLSLVNKMYLVVVYIFHLNTLGGNIDVAMKNSPNFMKKNLRHRSK